MKKPEFDPDEFLLEDDELERVIGGVYSQTLCQSCNKPVAVGTVMCPFCKMPVNGDRICKVCRMTYSPKFRVCPRCNPISGTM